MNYLALLKTFSREELLKVAAETGLSFKAINSTCRVDIIPHFGTLLPKVWGENRLGNIIVVREPIGVSFMSLYGVTINGHLVLRSMAGYKNQPIIGCVNRKHITPDGELHVISIDNLINECTDIGFYTINKLKRYDLNYYYSKYCGDLPFNINGKSKRKYLKLLWCLELSNGFNAELESYFLGFFEGKVLRKEGNFYKIEDERLHAVLPTSDFIEIYNDINYELLLTRLLTKS